jgi:hypothetical protein
VARACGHLNKKQRDALETFAVVTELALSRAKDIAIKSEVNQAFYRCLAPFPLITQSVLDHLLSMPQVNVQVASKVCRVLILTQKDQE